tara:strand:- start:920 stop:1093 length:174 start_codon:yes stop_codon:yes gene_type:complete
MQTIYFGRYNPFRIEKAKQLVLSEIIVCRMIMDKVVSNGLNNPLPYARFARNKESNV